MSVHFSNLYGIFKNSSYHVSKEKTSAQRQKRKKTLLGRPIFTLNLPLQLFYCLPVQVSLQEVH